MPIIAILLGVVCVDLAYRGTAKDFASQMAQDFEGGDFWAWLGAIIAVGAVGYYQPARRLSDLFIALIVLSLVVSNQGIFDQLASALKSPPAPTQAIDLPQFTTSSGSTGGSGSTIVKAAETAGTVAGTLLL